MGELRHLKSVLVVEDEGLIRMDLEDTLRSAGVGTVIGVGTLANAFAAVEQAMPDAVVLDLHLGREGWSFDFAKRLKSLELAFLFSAGSPHTPEGFENVPLLIKPFSGEQLVTALRAITAPPTEAAQ